MAGRNSDTSTTNTRTEFDPNSTGPSGYITSSTPITTGIPTSRPFDRPQSVVTVQPTTASEADLVRNYNEMSEALRKSLAQKLKSAGYNVPVTGKYSAKVRQAFIDSIGELSDEISTLQKNDPRRLETTKYDLDTFLNDKIGERQASFAEEYKPTRTINVSPATVAAGRINKIFNSLLGRDATEVEVAQFTSLLNKAEEKNPDVSTPKLVGGSVVYTNTGGLDRDTFLEGLVKKVKSPETGKPEYEVRQESQKSLLRQDLATAASANGLSLDRDFKGLADTWVKRIESGEDPDIFKQMIRDVAKRGYPESVTKLIDQGIDLDTIYSPYKRAMASILELSPETISVNDPTLRSAIGPEREMTIYDFEKALRKDYRWQYTDNAKRDVSNVALKVLRDFGFQA
jgi:hypothetical protein